MPLPNTTADATNGAAAADMRRIAVIGAGYVGLTAAACLALLGHRVVCADTDVGKVDRLRGGRVDIHEPLLANLVTAGLSTGLLSFAVGITDAIAAVGRVDVVLVCVPTPSSPDGSLDLSTLRAVIIELGTTLAPGRVISVNSTVPAHEFPCLESWLGRHDLGLVSNPEFLRKGRAVEDFLRPDRIVVGARDSAAAHQVAELYARLDAPILFTDPVSAALIKNVANGYLAMRLSYVNAISQLCDRVGGNTLDVVNGMGYDQRIGRAYLRPGPGWGGPSLPKDTSALLHMSDDLDFEFPLLRATIETNDRQTAHVLAKIRLAATGTPTGVLTEVRVGMLGLAFKPGTDDLHCSPALRIATELARAGARVVGQDPAVRIPAAVDNELCSVVEDPYQVARNAHVVAVVTDWPEFAVLDWSRIATLMTGRAVVDACDSLDPKIVVAAGLDYLCMGRGSTMRPELPASGGVR